MTRTRDITSALSIAGWLGLAILSAGCQGEIGGGGGGETPDGSTPIPGDPATTPAGATPPTCTAPAPGPSPLRRLTHREYDNTTRDLLGDTSRPGAQFSREEVFLGFDNSATARGTTTLLAEQYLNAAETLAARAVQNLPTFTGCNPDDAAGRDACARQFIDRFASKAYRRPLVDEDRARLETLYASANQQWGFAKAIELTTQTVLQSPHYLYRVELGVPSSTPGVELLTPYELASRLSYLLWASMPDRALLDAADSGQLTTREQVAAQARRMLQSEHVKYVLSDFHRQWLGLDLFDTIESTLAGFSDDLRPLLRQETEKMVEAALWQDGGKLSTLLTAPFSFMNARLAGFYGLAGPTGAAFERVALDPTQRLGLLTQGGILAAHSHAAKTSPVLRGKFVREQLLCNPPPPPPPGVDFTVAEKDSELTVREQAQIHSADPGCAACHQFMDPIGLAFEGFDAVGRFRSSENGQPIDVTGNLFATDVDGAFQGPAELAHKLAGSQQVAGCVVRQWFRYAYARDEVVEQDACSVSLLESEFQKSGGDIKQLLFSLTQTDAFMFRSVAQGEAP